MKLNFDFTLTNLSGEPLKDEQGIELHAGRTAANLLVQATDTGADIMERYDWATQLHKNGTVDLDKAGQEKFRRAVQNLPNVWLIVRARLLEVLEKRTEELTN